MQINNKTFHITTLGCRVNLYESNSIVNQLIEDGAKQVASIDDAQICIINTCCVTQKAESKSKYFINRAIRSTNCELIIVIGCFSQLSIATLQDKKIGIILGTKYKSILGQILSTYQLGQRLVQIENFSKADIFEHFEHEVFLENTRAFIKIQDGCDFMCTYCIIPFVRGRQRSLEHKFILNTIEELCMKDYKEIVLTGVNTAGYREDDHYGFLELLNDIKLIPGNFRVRISSIEPFQITNEIIDLIADNPNRFTQHFHLCIQSANDQVIKDMKRKYTINDFIKICNYIRTKSPYASITTDYIVGFPTETDALFNDGISNLQKIKFADMHIFPYSSRPMTSASKLKNIVTDSVKTQRVKQVQILNQQMQNEYLKQFINKETEVLFEHSNDSNVQTGHSQYFFTVNVDTKKQLLNQL
jgi:threonylcarbamoyladenosine tRNA methylthiotransferase MtaB